MILRNGFLIGGLQKPYIVAEVNTSHNGNIDIAKEMIKKATACGCNCVKFQSWTADSLYSKTYYKENPIAKRMFTKFSLSEEQLLEMSLYSKECGIDFASTPYSKKEVDFLLEKCNIPFIKVASMDINNIPFLDYVARTKAPIVLATGMADMDEIKKAVQTIEDAGNTNICILHCVSIYPAKSEILRLNNIRSLIKEFSKYGVGYSDHSIGVEMASAAIALGAVMIEKHFTLDNTKIGMDNQMATEPNEMTQLVKNCLNVYTALGEESRIVSNEEIEQRKKMRRSIVSTRDIKAGETIHKQDLDFKRPGTGILPERIIELIGRTIINDIEEDTLIQESDLQ